MKQEDILKSVGNLPKQLTNEHELIGKTIKAIEFDEPGVLMSFSDGTCVIINAEGDDEDGHYLTVARSMNRASPQALLHSEIITRDQFDLFIAARQKEREAFQDAEDRATYEKLKAKFEKPRV